MVSMLLVFLNGIRVLDELMEHLDLEIYYDTHAYSNLQEYEHIYIHDINLHQL